MKIERIETGARMSKVVIHGDTVYLAGFTANKALAGGVAEQTARRSQAVGPPPQTRGTVPAVEAPPTSLRRHRVPRPAMVGEHGRVGRVRPGGAQGRRRLPTIGEPDRRLGFSGLWIDAHGPDYRPCEFPDLRVRRRVATSHGADIGFIR
jgi:hypothetical protein